MGIFLTDSFAAIAENYKIATDWLFDLGIRWQVTRFRRYTDLAVCFAQGSAAERNALLDRDRIAIYNASLEIGDLLDIYSAFSGKYDAQVQERLRTFAGGPERYPSELTATSANRARDIGFELRLLSLLIRAGLTPDFSLAVDAAGRIGSRTFLFECKRPQLPRRVMPCFRDATKQLERTLITTNRPGMRGVVAIEATKLANPNLQLARYGDRSDLSHQVEARTNAFLSTFKHQWHQAAKSRIVAAIVIWREVAVVPSRDGPDPYKCESMLVAELPSCSMRDSQVLRDFLPLFAPRNAA